MILLLPVVCLSEVIVVARVLNASESSKTSLWYALRAAMVKGNDVPPWNSFSEQSIAYLTNTYRKRVFHGFIKVDLIVHEYYCNVGGFQ